MISRSILGLIIFSLSKETLDLIKCLRMIPVIDSSHLALPSPVTRGEMIDL